MLHGRRVLSLALLGVLAWLAAPVAPARGADKVTLQMNWFHLADHSPFYLARKKGHFAAEGIDLTLVRGSGSGDAAKKVDLRQAEVGIADTPTVLTAISKGADLVIVGIVFDKAGNNAFFYKDAGIRTPKDLTGKKVATPPADSHRVLWPAFARANGLEPDAITMVNVKPEGKQAIVAGRQVDASFDLYTSYPIWEKVLGKGNVGNLLWADHGVQLYGHAYMVHRDLVKKNPGLIRRFLRATYLGWRDAQLDPAGAIDAMTAEVAGLDREALLATMPYVLDLVITERSRQHGLGWIVPDLMQRTLDITWSGGAMEKKLAVAEVFTNDFNSRIKPAK
jgi:NitT/TauT family transport system substrate-binding protein